MGEDHEALYHICHCYNLQYSFALEVKVITIGCYCTNLPITISSLTVLPPFCFPAALAFLQFLRLGLLLLATAFAHLFPFLFALLILQISVQVSLPLRSLPCNSNINQIALLYICLELGPFPPEQLPWWVMQPSAVRLLDCPSSLQNSKLCIDED